MTSLVFRPPPLGTVLSLTGLPGGSDKIYDRSPYGHIGTITGATWVRLPSGLWCLNFDGSDDQVSPGAGNFDTLTQATIEFWYRPNVLLGAGGVHRYLFCAYKDAQNFLGVYYSHTGGMIRTICLVGNVEQFRSGDLSVGQSQTWHHCVVTMGIGNSDMWIDTVKTTQNLAGEACFDDIAATTANYFGAFEPASNTWSGDIALFRVYNKRLSALQVQSHFDQEKHLFGVWQV